MHTSGTKGFTLIETFVAVTILVFAVAGPLTIVSRGLNSTLVARDQLTATYLAQEAVEYIRTHRDDNILEGRDWLNGLSDCASADGCYFDIYTENEPDIDPCSGQCPLMTDDTGQSSRPHYSYETGSGKTPSIFRRTVWIEGSGDRERTVHVKVEWQSGVFSHEANVYDQITNWGEDLL